MRTRQAERIKILSEYGNYFFEGFKRYFVHITLQSLFAQTEE